MTVVQHTVFSCACCESEYSTLKEARKCAQSHIYKDTYGKCTICGLRTRTDEECCTIEKLEAKLEALLAKKEWKGHPDLALSWADTFKGMCDVLMGKLEKARKEAADGLQHVQNS